MSGPDSFTGIRDSKRRKLTDHDKFSEQMLSGTLILVVLDALRNRDRQLKVSSLDKFKLTI